MKSLFFIVPALIGALPILATENVDSLRPPHQLRDLEVVGVKQNPDAQAEAITSISGAEARRMGIESAHAVGEIAPNVYMPTYGSRMTSSIYVRGIGARMDQPVMGLSIDNVPVLNKDAYDFDIAEIENIEILRGAQAILNGRNTMGGQINIRTLSPLSTSGLRIHAGYGNGNTARAGAAYYGRLSDVLGMSISADFNHSDGFFRNAFDNSRIDTENSSSARWKTAWRPNSALSISNTASFALTRQGGYPYENVESGIISYNDTCAYNRTMLADGLSIAWAGKRVVVTSQTSIQYLDDDMRLDQDFLPLEYFTLDQKRKEWSFTEDLFARGARGAYSWLGGVFIFHKSMKMDAPVEFKNVGISELIEKHRNSANPEYPIEWDSRRFTLGSTFTTATTGAALYHQSTFRLGRWRFMGGIRLDFEHAALDYVSSCNTGYTNFHLLPDGTRQFYSHVPIIINDGDGLSKDFLEFLPQLTVEWEYEPFAPYFNFSKGYKSGGFNTQMFSDVLQQRIMSTMGLSSQYSMEEIVAYKPEYSFNYELGFHSRLPKINLSLEGVAFLIDCRNQQITTFPSGTTTGRIMTNAGRTRSFGAELSASYRPIDDLSFRFAYGYTNARFRKYSNGLGDFRGKFVPYAPANTVFAEVLYRASTLCFAGVVPSVSADIRGAGRIFWDEANLLKQNFYATLGASLRFEAPNWSFQLWARNITDTQYHTFYFVSIGNAFTQRALPRTFGVSLRLNFSSL